MHFNDVQLFFLQGNRLSRSPWHSETQLLMSYVAASGTGSFPSEAVALVVFRHSFVQKVLSDRKLWTNHVFERLQHV